VTGSIERNGFLPAVLKERIDALWKVIDERDRRYASERHAQDAAVKTAQINGEKAIDKAETAMGARLDLLNEFRAQAGEQAQKYITKEEFGALRAKVDDIQRTIYIATGGAIVVATLLSFVIRLFTPLGGK
jgi:hypothetical protein